MRRREGEGEGEGERERERERELHKPTHTGMPVSSQMLFFCNPSATSNYSQFI